MLLIDRVQVEPDFTLIACPNAQLMLVSDETLFIGIISDIALSQADGTRRASCHAIDLTDTVNVNVAALLQSRAVDAVSVDVVELFTANDASVMRLVMPVLTLASPTNVLHVHVALDELEALALLTALLPGTTNASDAPTLVFSAHSSQTELTLVPAKLLVESERLHLDPQFVEGLVGKGAQAASASARRRRRRRDRDARQH